MWYDFADAIVTIGRKYTRLKSVRVTPIKTADYPTPAARPAFSALDCSLIAQHYGISTKPWRDSLEMVIREIFSNPAGPMLA
jgi:dTDP-4-dehydrorhamnose reductase